MNPPYRASQRREQFCDLVRAHGTAMVTLARRLVGDGEAEDVVQAAVASAWRRFVGAEEVRSPRAWLSRFVVHECGNLVGRRIRRPAAIALDATRSYGRTEDILTVLQKELAYSASSDPRSLLDWLDEGLSRALAALSDDERTTLFLRSVSECSYKEIAETMDVPIGTVMSRLARTREKVRVELVHLRDGSSAKAAQTREAPGEAS